MKYQTLAGLKILSVENDPLNAEAIQLLLMVVGASVIGSVSSVADAALRLDLDPPDVVVVDYRLDGETCERLIELMEHRSVPYVMVSACHPDTLPISLQGARWVQKPFAIEALIASIAEAIDAVAHRTIAATKSAALDPPTQA